MIIQTILEGILRSYKKYPILEKGIVKSHLIDYCGLKTTTAEKYLKKMENADYIISYEEPWGDRKRIIYEITTKGRERYQWFVKINTELQ